MIVVADSVSFCRVYMTPAGSTKVSKTTSPELEAQRQSRRHSFAFDATLLCPVFERESAVCCEPFVVAVYYASDQEN